MKCKMCIYRDFRRFEKLYDTAKTCSSRLESVYTGNCIKGSNPFLSASEAPRIFLGAFLFSPTSLYKSLHYLFCLLQRVVISNAFRPAWLYPKPLLQFFCGTVSIGRKQQ